MKVLSLFDGLAGARLALDYLGVTPKSYLASEIDEAAMKVAIWNFHDIEHIGDVKNIIIEDLPKDIDLLIGGSPCQDLSSAGKREGIKGRRSGLFWEYSRILKEISPKYFLLENVASMSRKSREVITRELGVEPIMIDSSLVTAQVRKRLYWTNIPGVIQPEDRGIKLKDILDQNVPSGFLLSESYFLIPGSSSPEDLDYVGGVTRKGANVWLNNGKTLSRNFRQGNRVYSDKGKAATLNANNGNAGGKTGLYLINNDYLKTEKTPYHEKHRIRILKNSPCCVAERGRRLAPCKSKRDDKNGKVVRGFEFQSSEKTGCLTTVQKDNYIADGHVIRRLTPIECERLQGIPDGYTFPVTHSQRYKMIGNSFTIPVISHILSFMPDLKNDGR